MDIQDINVGDKFCRYTATTGLRVVVVVSVYRSIPSIDFSEEDDFAKHGLMAPIFTLSLVELNHRLAQSVWANGSMWAYNPPQPIAANQAAPHSSPPSGGFYIADIGAQFAQTLPGGQPSPVAIVQTDHQTEEFTFAYLGAGGKPDYAYPTWKYSFDEVIKRCSYPAQYPGALRPFGNPNAIVVLPLSYLVGKKHKIIAAPSPAATVAKESLLEILYRICNPEMIKYSFEGGYVPPKCECGAASVGAASHSDWCPIK